MPSKPKHIHRAPRTDNAQQKFDPPSTCPGCSAMELPRTAPCKHQIAIRDNRTPPSPHQNAHKKVASLGAHKNPASQTPCPPKPAPKPAAPPATPPEPAGSPQSPRSAPPKTKNPKETRPPHPPPAPSPPPHPP